MFPPKCRRIRPQHSQPAGRSLLKRFSPRYAASLSCCALQGPSIYSSAHLGPFDGSHKGNFNIAERTGKREFETQQRRLNLRGRPRLQDMFVCEVGSGGDRSSIDENSRPRASALARNAARSSPGSSSLSGAFDWKEIVVVYYCRYCCDNRFATNL